MLTINTIKSFHVYHICIIFLKTLNENFHHDLNHFISMSNLNFEYTYLNYTCMYINPNPLKNHRNLNLIKIEVEAYIIENMEKQEQNH